MRKKRYTHFIKYINTRNLSCASYIKQRINLIQIELKRRRWKIVAYRPNNYCLTAVRLHETENPQQINIYLTTLTIQTAMNHTKGKKQLNRKCSTVSEIFEIIKDPRKHTGKGYYKKK